MRIYKTTNPLLKRYGRDNKLRVVITFLFMICIMTSTFYLLFDSHFKANINDNNVFNNVIQDNDSDMTLKPSAGIEIFQDPFTTNFQEMLQFFNNKFKTGLNLDVNTYFRESNASGVITNQNVYPVDTILLYNTLMRDHLTAEQTFSNYLALKDSNFWYDKGEFNYGFITSVDNSTGLITNDRRSLIDNLMAITLLVENIGTEITAINQDGVYPKDSINEMFNLINSSQFWDSTNNGFAQYNTTDFSENKFTKSNLYAILTNLQIRNLYERLSINPEIKDRAYWLANTTMETLLLNMWDGQDLGFYYNAKNDWTPNLIGSKFKYLDVNALGIITLIDYWLETGKNNGSLLQKAISTFEEIDANLWDATYKAYQYGRERTWTTSFAGGNRIELKANSLMMLACLKLFEVTGNFTFYDRAFQLHSTFDSDFFDINAYSESIYSPVNDTKNLNSNLKLVKSYLQAFEIFNNTILDANFNISTEIPNYIFNQDKLNIESKYFVNNPVQYYNYSTGSYKIFNSIYNITSADITYILKYPNGTLFDTKEKIISGTETAFEYDINETLTIGDGYYIYIYSNYTYFATAQVLKRFNIISGLDDFPILNLPSTIYQGPEYNITLPVNNTRNQNINLTVSMEGSNIISESKVVQFTRFILTNISFTLEAKLGATIGLQNISFTFKDGDVIYLKLAKTINIGHSIDYSEFLYKNRIVSGDKIQVMFNLINFLPNTTQSCNISFSGPMIQNIKQEINLDPNEKRSLYYELISQENIIQNSITVKFEISKGNTILYSRNSEIEILPELEILSAAFPVLVSQGEKASFIMIIWNNRDSSIPYSLSIITINGESTHSGRLAPGENRIQAEVVPTIFPYDFFDKTYIFQLKDDSGDIITQYYYTVSIDVSPTNILLFYVLPVAIAIGIMLYYKNKELKHNQLRR
jgi:hypothetical protein